MKVYATKDKNNLIQLWGKQPHYCQLAEEWLGEECITLQPDDSDAGWDLVPTGWCREIQLSKIHAAMRPGAQRDFMFAGDA